MCSRSKNFKKEHLLPAIAEALNLILCKKKKKKEKNYTKEKLGQWALTNYYNISCNRDARIFNCYPIFLATNNCD